MRALLLAAVLVVLPGTLGAQTPALQALKIARAVLSESEDGAPIESGAVFQAGESIYLSFQLENYRIGPTGKIQLAGFVEAFDPKGHLISPRDEMVIGTTLSDEDKNWKPKLRSQLQVPPIAPPGLYTIKFEASDPQSGQKVSSEMMFRVGGRRVEPSETLAIREFGFYRTQEDEMPLKTVAYRGGDMLWARFDIIGYRYGEQNSVDVTYDVAVFAPSGKQLFAQEDAAVERSQAFYPQPWVPAAFNLSLQSNMTPGTYALEITARDGVGKQTASVRSEFRVE